MDSRKIVFRQTVPVAVGQAIGVALMLVVFAALGRFSSKVLLGGIIGYVLSVGNFFFMAMGTSLAADKAEEQNVKGGQLLLRSSYIMRLAVLFILLFASAKSGFCNPVALAVPLLFVRPVLTIAEFFHKKGEDV